MRLTTESAPTAVAADLAEFVTESPSSFHAADAARRRLTAAGFTELDERAEWDLRPGGRHLVVRDGAIIAWVISTSLGTPFSRSRPRTCMTAPRPSSGIRAVPIDILTFSAVCSPISRLWLRRR